MTTVLSSWVRALLALSFASAAIGCGSDSADRGEPGDESAVETAATAASAYRYDDPDIGTWIFRVEKKRTKLTGHFLVPVPRGVPTLDRGKVSGTVGSDGKWNMTWELPGFGLGPAAPLTFVGENVNGRLEGIRKVDGEPDKPAKLEPIARGTLEEGRPIAVSFQSREEKNGCHTDSSGFEVFALSSPDVEKTINGHVESTIDTARAKCEAGVAYVVGGGYLSLLRKDIASYSLSYWVDDVLTVVARHNITLDTGAPLSLFGDVLAPGSEATLRAEMEKVIDALPTRDITPEKKAELATVMKARADQGKLGEAFVLGERGVALAAVGFDHPHYRSVVVPYAALGSALAQSGRARSAWQP